MNSIITNVGAIAAFTIAIVLAVIALDSLRAEDAQAGNPLVSPHSLTASGTRAFSVNANGWAEQIIATTTGANPRLFARICNHSTNLVYLAFEADMFTNSSSSLALGQGTAGIDACYELTDRNMYYGSVRASSTNAATAVTVLLFEQ